MRVHASAAMLPGRQRMRRRIVFPCRPILTQTDHITSDRTTSTHGTCTHVCMHARHAWDSCRLHTCDTNMHLCMKASPTCVPRVAGQVVCERVRAERLVWGDEADIRAMRACEPRGFDLIVGSDLLYQRGALPLLMRTCSALLRPMAAAPVPVDAGPWAGAQGIAAAAGGGFGGPRVLLCFKPRNNMQAHEYVAAAAPFGLEQDACPPPELLTAAATLCLGGAGVQLLLLRWAGEARR